MSLYNLIHGVNGAADVLLAMLGIGKAEVPRFRDCYLEEGRIAVYTRTGGGNRPAYENEETCRENYPEYFTHDEPHTGPYNDDLRALPGFVEDKDDDFDSTYATFYFTVPEKFVHLVGKIPEGKIRSQMWKETLDHLKTATPDDPTVKKLTEVFKPVFEKLAEVDKEQS